MMGSAYLYGLAQANLEINAVQGILLGAFVFVPSFKGKNNHHYPIYTIKTWRPNCPILPLANMGLFATVTWGQLFFGGPMPRIWSWRSTSIFTSQ